MIAQIERDGFAVVPAVLGQPALCQLVQAIETHLPQQSEAGIRGLAAKVPEVLELARSSEVRALVEPMLGSGARLVRSILFSKSAETNWQVPWHQDLAIAVQSRAEVEGYASWSIKEGVMHVQPPVAVLEQMLSVRLHLDPADESNGALWVSPGSHRLGRMPASAAASVVERLGKQLCAVNAGDALLFRPLILHASRKATSSRPRRVIHLEFAAASLPLPLAWIEAA